MPYGHKYCVLACSIPYPRMRILFPVHLYLAYVLILPRHCTILFIKYVAVESLFPQVAKQQAGTQSHQYSSLERKVHGTCSHHLAMLHNVLSTTFDKMFDVKEDKKRQMREKRERDRNQR